MRDILADIELGGDEAARSYAAKLDNFTGNIILNPDEIEAACAQVSATLKADIQFAHDNVRRFAEAQKQSLRDFELEVVPGLTPGQKSIPERLWPCGWLLCARRALQPCRQRDHVGDNRKSCRVQTYRGLLAGL